MRTLSITLVSLASAALLALADPAAAQAPAAKLMPGSEIGFVSKQMGVPVSGKFTRFDAQIAFDPRKPETGKVGFTIDTGSATIGDPETDRELPKAPWFNATRFPQASFQSSSIKALGGGKFEVAGRLAIKGSSQDIVVPVALTQSGAPAATATTATGSFAIKRLAFKIGEGEWTDTSMVADEVQVRFKLALTGVGPL